ncbi:hypothetical protein VT84_37140 [Gemmata sp. SH-PL17]|uniref:hypothetical protein n=1 Tax=Gemmata sp. SH-PL17 TaxID=1630693 RepID=UPI00078D4AAF|nr:hypothetical protein [Gemmata sp. SH-PL17]AMV30079.1 hypothetical protein VT84_37140 [Gemmata sp. SH-PL17]
MADEVYLGPGVPRLKEMGEHFERQVRLLTAWITGLGNMKCPGLRSPSVYNEKLIKFKYLGNDYLIDASFDVINSDEKINYLLRLEIVQESAAKGLAIGGAVAFLDADGTVFEYNGKLIPIDLKIQSDAEKLFAYLAMGHWAKPSSIR